MLQGARRVATWPSVAAHDQTHQSLTDGMRAILPETMLNVPEEAVVGSAAAACGWSS
jgi:hypothetical protein